MMDRAIMNLRPGARWQLHGDSYDGLIWDDADQTKPTEDEITAEMARLAAGAPSPSYAVDRLSQYPSIHDQLDLLWHAMDTGEIPKATAWYSAIAAVKAANPKP